MKIYLDDERECPKGYQLVRSVNMAKFIILWFEANNIEIELIDMDHDLGEYSKSGGDGIELLDWLVKTERFYPIKLHTMNPVGKENMQRIIDKYWK